MKEWRVEKIYKRVAKKYVRCVDEIYRSRYRIFIVYE